MPWTVVALHTISRNPTGRVETTGRTHPKTGLLITRAAPEHHPAGSTFEIEDEAEYLDLKERGAIEDVDHGREGESNSGTGDRDLSETDTQTDLVG